MESAVHTGTVRVLFVSDHFGHPGNVIHGATRYFLTVLPRLVRRGIDLHVAFLRDDHPASGRMREQGIDPVFFHRAKWNPRAVIDVYRHVHRNRVQVIHCAGMKGILVARIVGRLAGVPVVEHLHDCEPVPTSLLWPLRWTRSWSVQTLAVSRDVAEYAGRVLQCDPARVEVLHNGLVLGDLRDTPASAGPAFRQQYGLRPEDKLIACVGRLAPVKGQETLLRAMPAVLAKEPAARLVLIGDGPDRPVLNARVQQLGLGGYVTFTGQITDVYSALRGVDVVAMPSMREGLPYSLLEAMAMDKPVVASAVGGLAETIKHCENGVLFRVGDAQALSKAILSVLTDTLLTQTIAKGARETIKAFDIERHVDRLVTVYEALAAGRPVPAAPPPRTATETDAANAQTSTPPVTSDTTI